MLARDASVHIGTQVVSADTQVAPDGHGRQFAGLYESPDGTGRDAQVVGDLIDGQQQCIRHAQATFADEWTAVD